MINRMLLKSEAVCMQPVPMETLTPTKYESIAFYHTLYFPPPLGIMQLLTKCGRSSILLSTVSPMTGFVFRGWEGRTEFLGRI